MNERPIGASRVGPEKLNVTCSCIYARDCTKGEHCHTRNPHIATLPDCFDNVHR